ncbi:MAG: hypothetical protein R2864_00230 [Syntrophotaleaceae bacterium]
MTGMAAGLAAGGMIPFASTFAVFAAGELFERIRQSVAIPASTSRSLPPTAVSPSWRGWRLPQSVEDLAIMRSLPKMTVLLAADGPKRPPRFALAAS